MNVLVAISKHPIIKTFKGIDRSKIQFPIELVQSAYSNSSGEHAHWHVDYKTSTNGIHYLVPVFSSLEKVLNSYIPWTEPKGWMFCLIICNLFVGCYHSNPLPHLHCFHFEIQRLWYKASPSSFPDWWTYASISAVMVYIISQKCCPSCGGVL